MPNTGIIRVLQRHACLYGLLLAACGGTGSEPPRVASLQAALEDELTTRGEADVVINLHEPQGPFETREQRRLAIERVQGSVLEKLGAAFTLSRRFRHVPAIAGRITQEGLRRIEGDPNVSYIQLDSVGGGQLKEAVPAIGGDRARTMFNVTGKGVRVAVLDTGIDTDHPDLAGAVIAQHCFTRGACPPGFASEGTSGEDDHGHGSNVTGIVASRGKVSSMGFAPDAELVAVKINDRNDSGRASDWVAGLDWVYDNLATNKVRVVNMSIGTTAMYAPGPSCDTSEPALAGAVKNLVDAGVTLFAASGNRGSSTMLAAPACNTGVIAVGAIYDTNGGHMPPNSQSYSARWGNAFANCADDPSSFDQITCFTNSNSRLDIVAPGAPILSDTLNGRTELYFGTSQASPAAAGVAALMVQCKPELKPAEIKAAMVKTGVPRMDPKNGLMFPSLRAFEAVQSVCGSAVAPVAGAGAATPGGMAGAPSAAGSGGLAGAPVIAAGAPAPGAGAGVGAPVPPPPNTGTLVNPVSAAGAPAPAAAGASGTGLGVAAGRGGSGPFVTAGATSLEPRTEPPEEGCSCRTAGARTQSSAPRASLAAGLVLCALSWRSRRKRRERRQTA